MNIKQFISYPIGLVCGVITTALFAWPDSAYLIWQSMPEYITNRIPEQYTPVIGAIIYVVTITARLFREKKNVNRKSKIKQKDGC